MTVENDIKINGTSLPLQPSSHHWVNRDRLGVDGNGRGIYAIYREYELSWEFLSPSQFNDINNFYLSVGQTGTVTADLPEYPPVSVYQFRTYSGCILREQTYSEYFENFYSDVKLLIVRIRTT